MRSFKHTEPYNRRSKDRSQKSDPVTPDKVISKSDHEASVVEAKPRKKHTSEIFRDAQRAADRKGNPAYNPRR
jgi:hypothetical protein